MLAFKLKGTEFFVKCVECFIPCHRLLQVGVFGKKRKRKWTAKRIAVGHAYVIGRLIAVCMDGLLPLYCTPIHIDNTDHFFNNV